MNVGLVTNAYYIPGIGNVGGNVIMLFKLVVTGIVRVADVIVVNQTLSIWLGTKFTQPKTKYGPLQGFFGT